MDIIAEGYHPAQDAVYGTSTRPLVNCPTYSEAEHWFLSVQPFRAGGFEATLGQVNLQSAADRAYLPYYSHARVEPLYRSQLSLESSRARAKSTVRKRVKDMGGNRLITLTLRQSDSLGYFSISNWENAFASFIRLIRKAGYFSDYVAVLEPHKIGLERLAARRDGVAPVELPGATFDIPLHMHIVTRSDFKMPIAIMRKCWLLAAGRDGNIDVQFLRPARGRDAVDKVASYVSKYITKGLAEMERFNKKRYWSAGLPLLPKSRTWLSARTLKEAQTQCLLRLRMSEEDLFRIYSARCLYVFPGDRGFWLNFRPGHLAQPPPF